MKASYKGYSQVLDNKIKEQYHRTKAAKNLWRTWQSRSWSFNAWAIKLMSKLRCNTLSLVCTLVHAS